MRYGWIYLITNKVNGLKYVGQSIDVISRWSAHCRDSEIAIDKAIQKYGVENFKIEIIEENVPENELDEREIYWIDFYNTYKGKGYNQDAGGKVMRGQYNPMYGKRGEKSPWWGRKHTKKTREKISNNHADVSKNNNPKAKITEKLGEKIYKEYRNTNIKLKELANKYNLGLTTVKRVVYGRHWTTKKFGEKEKEFEWKSSPSLSKKIIKEYYNTNQSQYDLANKYGLNQGMISEIVNFKHWSTKRLTKLKEKYQPVSTRVSDIETSKRIIDEYNKSNISQERLAQKYGISRAVINRILNYKHWTTRNLKIS